MLLAFEVLAFGRAAGSEDVTGWVAATDAAAGALERIDVLPDRTAWLLCLLDALPGVFAVPRVVRVAPLVRACAVEPAVTELVAGAGAPADAAAGGALAGGDAGAAAALGGGAAGGTAGAAGAAPVGGGVAGGVGGAAGLDGVPKPAGVQAHASPAPTTATLSTDNTATQIIRACFCTGPSLQDVAR
ncbi:MAG: hypothetical protein KY463_13140 [Actinobacteria bacterium]|nr:hypothetical protein [Actinomycetota bacterium]